MSDNAASGNANGQYDSPPFGMGEVKNTGLSGSDTGSTYGAYDNGNLPGEHVADLASTSAPGSQPLPAGPRDGGSIQATDPFGYLNGSDAPQVHGSADTTFGGLAAGFDPHRQPELGQLDTSTGAGKGKVTHSAPVGEESSPWRNV